MSITKGLEGARSKGCGIVVFKTPDQARTAIRDLHDTELDGRQIFVREDREAGSGGGRQRRVAAPAATAAGDASQRPNAGAASTVGHEREFHGARPPPDAAGLDATVAVAHTDALLTVMLHHSQGIENPCMNAPLRYVRVHTHAHTKPRAV